MNFVTPFLYNIPACRGEELNIARVTNSDHRSSSCAGLGDNSIELQRDACTMVQDHPGLHGSRYHWARAL